LPPILGQAPGFELRCPFWPPGFVTDLVSEAGKEQLVLEEITNVIHPSKFGFGDGGNSVPDGGHGGRLVDCDTFVGCLDPDMVVINSFARLLAQVGKVGIGCTG
jgi:hypothetical protein